MSHAKGRVAKFPFGPQINKSFYKRGSFRLGGRLSHQTGKTPTERVYGPFTSAIFGSSGGTMNPDQPTKTYNIVEEPARLVAIAGSGTLKTRGEWIAWCRRVMHQHYKIRPWIWRKLRSVMSEDACRYLERWCERSGGNDDE